MPKKTSHPPSSKVAIIIIALIVVVGAVAVLYRVLGSPENAENQTPTPKPEVKVNKAPLPSQQVTVLTPEYRDGKLEFQEKEQTAPGDTSPEVFSINGFLAESKITAPEAKLESMELKDGVAILKFNKAFETTYGTEDERTLVEGILRTLGQNPEIKKVKFQIGDRDLETLGNIELIDPLPVIRAKRSQGRKASRS